MSLPQLPPLSKEGSHNYIDDNQEDSFIENEFMLSGQLAREYKRLKHSYRHLIQSFEESLQNDLKIFDDEEQNSLKNFKFKNLSEFEQAVENGFLNLRDYSLNEINEIIRELDDLEEKVMSRELSEYNFNTLDDFQNAVDKGLIDISKYEVDEINELLGQLEDEPLKLSDYDITTFGNVDLPKIEHRLNSRPDSSPRRKPRKTKPKPLTKDKLREIKASKDKKSILPQHPVKIEETRKLEEDKYISSYNENNIEDILERGFFSRLISKIKRKIFKRE